MSEHDHDGLGPHEHANPPPAIDRLLARFANAGEILNLRVHVDDQDRVTIDKATVFADQEALLHGDALQRWEALDTSGVP